VFVTNIPTPYRLHFCRVLQSALTRRGWTFGVWLMAESERGRHWQVRREEFAFPYRFFRGLHPRICGATLHFNPGIPLVAGATQPNILLVAGGWGMPTNLILTLVAKAMRTTTIFWSESHLASRRVLGAVTETLRGAALRLYQGFAVPGPLAREYVNYYAPGRPTFALPNVVDERIFGDRVSSLRRDREAIRRELAIDPSRRLLLTLARLIPEKGVLELVQSLAALPAGMTARFTLVVGGEGPLRSELAACMREHPDLDVRLIGHVGEADVLKWLAAADGFALPSRSEPNPLSAIEALWAGLPLLLSERVGNHPDLLQPGVNGWLFDPHDPEAIRIAVGEWVCAGDAQLAACRSASEHLARRCFRSDVIVDGFLDTVLGPRWASTS